MFYNIIVKDRSRFLSHLEVVKITFIFMVTRLDQSEHILLFIPVAIIENVKDRLRQLQRCFSIHGIYAEKTTDNMRLIDVILRDTVDCFLDDLHRVAVFNGHFL